jgi:hypothetical protein
MIKTQTHVGMGANDTGKAAVTLCLSDNAMFEDSATGEPRVGVGLSPTQAREVAYSLLLFALKVESAAQAQGAVSS